MFFAAVFKDYTDLVVDFKLFPTLPTAFNLSSALAFFEVNVLTAVLESETNCLTFFPVETAEAAVLRAEEPILPAFYVFLAVLELVTFLVALETF